MCHFSVTVYRCHSNNWLNRFFMLLFFSSLSLFFLIITFHLDWMYCIEQYTAHLFFYGKERNLFFCVPLHFHIIKHLQINMIFLFRFFFIKCWTWVWFEFFFFFIYVAICSSRLNLNVGFHFAKYWISFIKHFRHEVLKEDLIFHSLIVKYVGKSNFSHKSNGSYILWIWRYFNAKRISHLLQLCLNETFIV